MDDVINFKIYLRSSSKAMADREKKREEGIQKFEYLEIKESFFDEIQSLFHIYLRAIIWWKMKHIFYNM